VPSCADAPCAPNAPAATTTTDATSLRIMSFPVPLLRRIYYDDYIQRCIQLLEAFAALSLSRRGGLPVDSPKSCNPARIALSDHVSARAYRGNATRGPTLPLTLKENTMRTSARNQFAGTVADVKAGAVNDEITLRTQDGLEITAIITHGSAASLGL